MSRALILLALILAAPALANDSVAETAAGGLVLVPNGAVDMVSEDLYVSRLEVRVRYVFRNRTRAPVRVTVAFPMPDHDLAAEEEGDVAWPSDFHTSVAGREVPMRVERRALLNGVDHTALLTRLRIPIEGRQDDGAMVRALDALAPADQDRLAALGLIQLFSEPGTPRRNAAPRWTVKETWHWEQTFPVGRDLVVEHRYRPGVGGTVATALGSAEIRSSDYGRETIARYCIDDDLLATIGRIGRRNQDNWIPLAESWLSYILTTGANWRSPIGEFRLVVDKGDPNALVSFCGEGVRRISPTQFEVRHRNWRPTRDLHVLFLVPIGG
ncbi:MAG TPA: DUF4424 domain-containing protein [Allosphingosinicella sp.]|nr:DUF4424 domain-containing protein [Allosphingosinicella sp.]